MNMCKDCAYRNKKGCLVRKKQEKDFCFSFATTEEATKREEACMSYSLKHGIANIWHGDFIKFVDTKRAKRSNSPVMRRSNLALRKKITNEVLNEKYDKLINDGYTDAEIADKVFSTTYAIKKWKEQREQETNNE